MLSTIAKPFGILLLWLYHLVNNYGIAIFLFALVVKIILLPFQMKSKKSMMRMSALQPQVQALQKRHEGNPRKLQEETNKLYKEEHINPMSGCLWSLIPFPILIALYALARQPLSKLMGLAAAEITTLTETLSNMGLYTIPAKVDAYGEMTIANILGKNFSAVVSNPAVADFADKLKALNFQFLGMNHYLYPTMNMFPEEEDLIHLLTS